MKTIASVCLAVVCYVAFCYGYEACMTEEGPVVQGLIGAFMPVVFTLLGTFFSMVLFNR